jgi:hypothetical protein
MIEPVKVRAPMKTPTKISTAVDRVIGARELLERRDVAEARPTSTAAAPTKLCSIATSSGIEVMATRAAKIGADDRAGDDGRGQHAEAAAMDVATVRSRWP